MKALLMYESFTYLQELQQPPSAVSSSDTGDNEGKRAHFQRKDTPFDLNNSSGITAVSGQILKILTHLCHLHCVAAEAEAAARTSNSYQQSTSARWSI